MNWGGEGRGVVVLLRRLWEYRGSMQREGQARQGCLKRVCPRALQGRKANQAHTDPRPTKSERDSAKNLIDGGDGEQSPPSRLGIVSES